MTDKYLENYGNRILLSLRRIIGAIDAYSRKLASEHNITGTQLMCLHSIVKDGPSTVTALGKRYSLSASTLTGVIDRLESKRLVVRARNLSDRRRVVITATDAGAALISKAPFPLQDKLIAAIRGLPETEQAAVAHSLERVAELMQGVPIAARANTMRESGAHAKGN